MVKALNIIYGAGDYGQRALEMLNSMGVEVDFFTQSGVVEEKIINNVKLVPLCEIKELGEQSINFYVSINNKMIVAEIKQNLMYMFGSRALVYDCSSFVNDNYELKNRDYCSVCGNYVIFQKSGQEYGLFEKVHVIGAGVRKKNLCPICGSNDRGRWIYYVLKKHTKVFNQKCKVLHFAPYAGEAMLSSKLKKSTLCDYYGVDLDGSLADHEVDMTDICYSDNSFDMIIANHILEHIPDEKKAIQELKRVLKENGIIVLSFPICTDYESTIEQDEEMSSADRIRLFGQEDHVRLYGRDYVERIESYGLAVNVFSPYKELGYEEIDRMGLIEDDVCLICEMQ